MQAVWRGSNAEAALVIRSQAREMAAQAARIRQLEEYNEFLEERSKQSERLVARMLCGHWTVVQRCGDLVETVRALRKERNQLLRKAAKQLGAERPQTANPAVDVQAETTELKAKVAHLQAQATQNSQNSSARPSSERFKKPRTESERQRSGKKPGGQPGHPGSNLAWSSTPDYEETIRLETCPYSDCQADLREVEAEGHESYQQYDIPESKPIITQYNLEKKTCPGCKRKACAHRPPGVSPARTQWGPKMKAFSMYLHFYQFIPYQRLQELFAELLGQAPSKGSFVKWAKKTKKGLQARWNETRDDLSSNSHLLHFDETGMQVEKELQWMHVCVDGVRKRFLCFLHEKRGREAWDEMGVLKRCDPQQTTLLHDGFKPYFTFTEFPHALCHAHHLRELRGLRELELRLGVAECALAMRAFLKMAKRVTDAARAAGKKQLTPAQIAYLEKKFDLIVAEFLRLHPKKENPPGKKGRRAQSRHYNFARRAVTYRDAFLAFIRRLDIPFDNNLAERMIRMIALKDKISGCCRTKEGGKIFALMRSLIGTARLRGHSILEAMGGLFGVPGSLCHEKPARLGPVWPGPGALLCLI